MAKMVKRNRVCRHCGEPYGARLGRGLCSSCWRNPAIKEQYAPLAPFGGKAAQSFAVGQTGLAAPGGQP